VVFLSGRYSQGRGDNGGDKAPCTIMGIPVGQSQTPTHIETEGKVQLLR